MLGLPQRRVWSSGGGSSFIRPTDLGGATRTSCGRARLRTRERTESNLPKPLRALCFLGTTRTVPFPLSSQKREKKKKKPLQWKSQETASPATPEGCRFDSRLPSSLGMERKTCVTADAPCAGPWGLCRASADRQPEVARGGIPVALLPESCAATAGRAEPGSPRRRRGGAGASGAAVRRAPLETRPGLEGEQSLSFPASSSQFLGDGDLQAVAGTDTFYFAVYFQEDSEGTRRDPWPRSCNAGCGSDVRAAKPGLIQRKSICPRRRAGAAPGMQGHFLGTGACFCPPSVTAAGGCGAKGARSKGRREL